MNIIQQRLIISEELLTEYRQKCKRTDKRVTIKCFLLQLGYDPTMVSVAIDDQIVFSLEQSFIELEQRVLIFPKIAGG